MYGLTEEEKRRKAEYQQKEYENLPWNIPINYWDSVDLNVLGRHRRQQGLQHLDSVEANIKARETEQETCTKKDTK